jgi:hypothetical protein
MLRVGTDDRWLCRRALTRPGPGESPDEAARRLSGIRADDPHTILHSTSWRHEPDGQIVLTYAVCPDPSPWLSAARVPVLEIVRGTSPATPSPERVAVANVIAHAIRHLSFLMAEDPVVSRALAAHPEIAAALAPVAARA